MIAKGRYGFAGNVTQKGAISAHMAITANDVGNMNGVRMDTGTRTFRESEDFNSTKSIRTRQE